ncbi:HEPN domain-containing protein [Novosphingobium sp. BL-8A]|uniref:HEPN domain-containing protein n=1 Tax=Novosphingobium sp. BL-8A TaxID=3127639 RepID=UPI003757E165
MPNPQSVSEWLAVADRHAETARTLLGAGQYDNGWFHAGLSVECTLKAAIMHTERLNRWPERHERRELYTHVLHRLLDIAGVDLNQVISEPVAPALHVTLSWQRGEGYNPNAMPRKVASDMVEAATGINGVNRWIETRFRLPR